MTCGVKSDTRVFFVSANGVCARHYLKIIAKNLDKVFKQGTRHGDHGTHDVFVGVGPRETRIAPTL